jgi:hypothetical protein
MALGKRIYGTSTSAASGVPKAKVQPKNNLHQVAENKQLISTSYSASGMAILSVQLFPTVVHVPGLDDRATFVISTVPTNSAAFRPRSRISSAPDRASAPARSRRASGVSALANPLQISVIQRRRIPQFAARRASASSLIRRACGRTWISIYDTARLSKNPFPLAMQET